MHCPPHFQEDRRETLIDLIERYPLATIIRHGPSGLAADHVPLLHVQQSGTAGKLIGHVARNNPLWQCPADQELLVVFQGPSTYISPNWYASKHETGKVVPTWNYAVVHAYCSLRALDDAEQVRQIVTALTDRHEATQTQPWRVSDAPEEYTAKLLENIVGIELVIQRLQGKWKVSQNQPEKNRASIAQGLSAQGSNVHRQMAGLVESGSDR